MSVRHLYVHVPFCAHRCGYCDFVTVTGREEQHAAYVDAVLGELAREGHVLGDVETVFVGGGTPTLIGPALLERLLAGLPVAPEVTVEANPETVDDALATVLATHATRVSLGAQSFDALALDTLERRASPEQVRTAVERLRRAGVANLNLDLIFGIPGQSEDALARDLDTAVALEPEHVSYYELEAKPGTRFTHRHGVELERQAERLEGYYEQVIDTLETAGYRWYETANFCRADHRAQHNLAYWTGRDYLGIGVGAVSTLGLVRRANGPRLEPYLRAARQGEAPLRREERLTPEERRRELVMLGLRLDVPLALSGLEAGVDAGQVERLGRIGLVERGPDGLRLTRRGRMIANDVTATLIA